MIPEIGHYALILALCLASIQAIVPMVNSSRDSITTLQLTRYTTFGQLFFMTCAFSALAFCFLTNDFSVAYVAQNSNSKLPTIYRFCAIWGAHEGSLLLWVFLLVVWTSLVSLFSRSLPKEITTRVLAIMSMIAIGFYLFLLFTSDPFQRLLPNIPFDGRDLNPILQDPGLAIHPPMLYMGYVGFSVVFAFAMAALITGRLDAAWAKWSRPWTQIAWCFLTFGIVLGSWWAYRELGWGGWWFWDPVENASFLPWLIGTALIHSLAVTEKRDVFKAWTVFLAVCAFALSLLGTFLVRSGVLISVHAFATDPSRGLFLLSFLVLVIGAALALYAWRGNKIVNTGSFDLLSRETILLAGNVFLFIAMITILLGTLYPLIISVLNLGKLSVGAPYFNAVFIPLMLPMLFLMGLSPLFHWRSTDLKTLLKQLFYLLLFVTSTTFILLWFFSEKPTILIFLCLSLAFFIFCNTTLQLIRLSKKINILQISWGQWGMLLAHIGVAITVVGLTLTTVYSQQKNISMQLNDVVKLNSYRFKLNTVSPLKGPNYTGYQATISVYKHNQFLTQLHPEQRYYPIQRTMRAKTAIQATIFRDLYVALGEKHGNDAWVLRIYYKPFVRWIWAGGLFMVLGALLAMCRRRN